MQNLKGVIKFFTWVLVVVCLFQLSFTFVARNVKSKAEAFANAAVKVAEPANLTAAQQVLFRDSVEDIRKAFKRNYLDSVAGAPIVDVWALRDIYTYKFCREHALSLGLDLKGGMSLIMEISEDDVLRRLAGNPKNAQFNQAIANAKVAQTNQQADFLTLFKQEFERIDKNAKLSVIFMNNESYQGKIMSKSSNDEVINVLRKDFDAAIKETFNVLKTRIDQFGVASPNISLQENTGRIILELPGVEDPARVRKPLQQTAQLEFWDTYETPEIGAYLENANNTLRTTLQVNKAAVTGSDSTVAATADTTGTTGDIFGTSSDSSTTTTTDTSKG